MVIVWGLVNTRFLVGKGKVAVKVMIRVVV